MRQMILEVALPSTFAIGALLGRFLLIQAFILTLAVGIALWVGALLVYGVPLGLILLTSLCLAVAAQVGYAATLMCCAASIWRKQRGSVPRDPH